MNLKIIFTIVISLILSILFELYYLSFHPIYIMFLTIFSMMTTQYLLKNKPKISKFHVVMCFLFTTCILISSKGTHEHLGFANMLVYVLICLGAFMYLYLMLLSILLYMLNKQINVEEKPVKRVMVFIYSVPTFLIGSFFLLAFFPGVMTPDSFAQWGQAHGEPFHNWHPVMYTLLIQILTNFFDTPAIISFVQILFISGVIGYCLYRFEVRGIPKGLLIALSLAVAFMPMNGIYAVTIWKDILYNGFLLLLSMVMLELVLTKGKWIEKHVNLGVMIFASLGLVFFRHNGFPVFLVLSIFLLILFWNHRKRLLGVISIVIFAHLIFTGPIFQLLNVEESDPNEALSIPTQQLANVISNDGVLTNEQIAYLDQIFPIELWKEKYNPYITDPIKFSDEYDRRAIFPNQLKDYLTVWWNVCVQNPGLAFEAFVKQTSLVWQINEPAGLGEQATYVTYIHPNEYGINRIILNESLSNSLSRYLEITEEGLLRTVLWRPATHLFVLLFFIYIAFVRNGYQALLVALPTLLNLGTVFIAVPAQSYRYLYGTTLVLIIVIIFSFIKSEESKLA